MPPGSGPLRSFGPDRGWQRRPSTSAPYKQASGLPRRRMARRLLQLRLRCSLHVVLGQLGDEALHDCHRQHVACGRAHTQMYRMSARRAIGVQSMRHAYASCVYVYACGLARRAGEALCGVHLVSLCVLCRPAVLATTLTPLTASRRKQAVTIDGLS